MPSRLRRFHQSGQSHFITFSCYRRKQKFVDPETYTLFVVCLERMRRRFAMCVYGYVVMPEHVHLLVSEPPNLSLAEAVHFLKLSSSKRIDSKLGQSGDSFWQKRYYDRNIRNYRDFVEKLRYIHRNPVKRGLAVKPEEWKWSSFRHYALREVGVVGIESEWTARDRESKDTGIPGVISPRVSTTSARTWGTRHYK